jgi:hypothetical protein
VVPLGKKRFESPVAIKTVLRNGYALFSSTNQPSFFHGALFDRFLFGLQAGCLANHQWHNNKNAQEILTKTSEMDKNIISINELPVHF